MSAFMMSNETLSMLSDFIVKQSAEDSYFREVLVPVLGDEVFDSFSVFNALANLNIESLKRRYPDSYEELVGAPRYIPGCNIIRHEVFDIENGVNFMKEWHYQILKSLDCYLYQSMAVKTYKKDVSLKCY